MEFKSMKWFISKEVETYARFILFHFLPESCDFLSKNGHFRSHIIEVERYLKAEHLHTRVSDGQ